MSIDRLGVDEEVLRNLPDSMDWPERRELVRQLGELVAEGYYSPRALELIEQLARDPKWEVRKTVADQLDRLPEEMSERLAAELSQDYNAFVVSAVKNAHRRRVRKRRQREERRRQARALERAIKRLEKQYGGEAVRLVREMTDLEICRLMGAMAHELKAVLTPLLGRTARLRSDSENGRFDRLSFSKLLQEIAERLSFIERLVEDLEAYCQRTQVKCRPERLRDIVLEGCTIARERVQAGGRDPDQVQLVVDVPTVITLTASRHLLAGAIANVVHNAYDALLLYPQRAEHGRIEVAATSDGRQIELTVSDNGIGMDKQDLAETRRFVPGGSSKKGCGTGFGLPIALRNIEVHGGKLWIDSQYGEGTVVTIVLPKSPRAA